MVALCTLLSAFWIISANSWMQTPQGYEIVDGMFVPVDWLAVIFNPSFPYRLAHMVLAAFITTCFVIGGVSAWYLVRGDHFAAGRRGLKRSDAHTAELQSPMRHSTAVFRVKKKTRQTRMQP